MGNEKIVKEINKKFPRLHFSNLPTPFHKLENISNIVKKNIYCKRDDLTGFAFGGNKNRKLEFLIADALDKNCTRAIALGANQSNFCRMATAACVVNNIDIHLILGGKKPDKPTGNLLLDTLFGAVIHHVDSADWAKWEEEGKKLFNDMESKGDKVYWLPVGGSTPIGALGYIAGFFELLKDIQEKNLKVDTIIHSSSSAGTQAGLIVGKILSKWPGEIIGMGVAKTSHDLAKEVYDLAVKTADMFGLKISKDDVIVDNSYMGKEYAARTSECDNAITLFAQKEGIILDNVYTGKAAAGLLDYAKNDKLTDNATVFLHTGGSIELFE